MEFYLAGVVILSAVVTYGAACPTECTCNYNSNGAYVYCNKKNIGYIPTNLPNTTYYLRLDYDNITTIEENTFANLTNLYELHLYNNEISVIKENAFVNLPGLKYLYLSYNNITVLDPKMTRSMPNLYLLSLEFNKIKTIEENSFVNLTNLFHLGLHNNEISVIKEKAFVNLPILYNLYLHGNKIQTIEENSFVNLTNLYSLYLHGNKIQTIEENSFVNLTNLYSLSLYDNEISSIKQNAFVNLRGLQYLFLQNNKLTVIGARLFYDMDNLDYINLSGNNISFIESDAFGKTQSLQYLGLTSNPLICNCSILPFWTWLTKRPSLGTSAICSNGTYVTNITSSALDKCNETANGQWSNWGSWTACSMSCGNGTQYRNRYCNNPTPANGGSDCQGLNYETVSCNNGACPVSGQWSNWNSWTECSMTCGNGTQYRNRSCNNPTPANGGSDCQGLNYESVSCNNGTCPGRTCLCYNGGICTVRSDGQFLCTCVGKWKGEKCLESQCMSYDCGNDSCYVEPVNGSAKCFPQSGFCPTTTHTVYESNHAG